VLAFFETCVHPLHSSTRCRSAILLVDALIQSLSLTHIGASDQRASIFPAGQLALLPLSDASSDPSAYPCNCDALSSLELPETQTVAEIRREEARRMVWAAMMAHTVYTATEAEFHQGFLPLFITEPFNVRTHSLGDSHVKFDYHDP
jgi:hypothetical protein